MSTEAIANEFLTENYGLVRWWLTQHALRLTGQGRRVEMPNAGDATKTHWEWVADEGCDWDRVEEFVSDASGRLWGRWRNVDSPNMAKLSNSCMQAAIGTSRSRSAFGSTSEPAAVRDDATARYRRVRPVAPMGTDADRDEFLESVPWEPMPKPVGHDELLAIVEENLSHKPEAVRECVWLLASGVSQKNVAKVLGVTDRTIRNWLNDMRAEFEGMVAQVEKADPNGIDCSWDERVSVVDAVLRLLARIKPHRQPAVKPSNRIAVIRVRGYSRFGHGENPWIDDSRIPQGEACTKPVWREPNRHDTATPKPVEHVLTPEQSKTMGDARERFIRSRNESTRRDMGIVPERVVSNGKPEVLPVF